MHAAVVHNPKAGEGGPPSQELIAALRGIHWVVELVDEAELLAARPEAVVVIGGDGTVGRVAKRLAHTGVRLAVVPTGTANNIAQSLGLEVGDPISAIRRLSRPRELRADLGIVTSTGELFIEALGVGAFAKMLREPAMQGSRRIGGARVLLASELQVCRPIDAVVEVDGRITRGAFLFVEIMMAKSVGPALAFAPRAVMDDGLCDVVLATADHRGELLGMLSTGAASPLPCRRARHVRIECAEPWAHIDDVPYPLVHAIDTEVEPAAVRFLVPA